jgi:hypothetical protein
MYSVKDVESFGDNIDENLIPISQKKHNLKTEFFEAGSINEYTCFKMKEK